MAKILRQRHLIKVSSGNDGGNGGSEGKEGHKALAGGRKSHMAEDQLQDYQIHPKQRVN
jgi:hypothetical protein